MEASKSNGLQLQLIPRASPAFTLIYTTFAVALLDGDLAGIPDDQEMNLEMVVGVSRLVTVVYEYWFLRAWRRGTGLIRCATAVGSPTR
jgi:hypothetical protein